MTKFHFFFCFIFAFSMSSCVTSFQAVEVNPQQIKKVAIPKSLTNVYDIEHGNDQMFNEKLSDSMARFTSYVVDKFTPPRIERTHYEPANTLEALQYRTAVEHVVRKIMRRDYISDISLPDSVVSVFARCGSDLVLCSMTEGFSRTPSNYSKEVSKAIGRAVFAGIVGGLVCGAVAGSLGSGVRVTVNMGYYGGDVTRHGAVSFLFMIDVKKKMLVYFDSFLEPSSPTVSLYVERNIATMLNKYFLLKKVKPRQPTWRTNGNSSR